MAHLWIPDAVTRWALLPLEGRYFALSQRAQCPVRRLAGAHAEEGEVLLGKYQRVGDPESWVIKTQREASVSINGRPVYLGLRVLRDRDEIVLGGNVRLFFSTETELHVEPFPGAEHAVFCARCKQEITKGTPAVQCPGCGTWCEQTEEKPCWTYGPTCPMCDQPTALDSGFRWTPEEL